MLLWISDSLPLAKSTGGQDELVLVQFFPACRILEVFFDLGGSPDEADGLSGEAELPSFSFVPVLKLMGMG